MCPLLYAYEFMVHDFLKNSSIENPGIFAYK